MDSGLPYFQSNKKGKLRLKQSRNTMSKTLFPTKVGSYQIPHGDADVFNSEWGPERTT